MAGAMESVIICRCEDVHLHEIEACLTDLTAPLSAHELKLQTRAGMGVCQGRTCGPLIHGILSRCAAWLTDTARLAEGEFSPSPNAPVRPMTVAELALAGPGALPGGGPDEADH